MPEKENKESKELKTLVVSQLPVETIDETKVNGEKVKLVSYDDALTLILEKVTRIEKSVA